MLRFNLKKLAAVISETTEMDAERQNIDVNAVVLNQHGDFSDTVSDTNSAIATLVSDMEEENNTGTIAGIEAAAEHPDKVEEISEAIRDTIWESIKSFFKKIAEFIRGLILKVRALIGQYASTNEKFLAVIESELKNLKDKSLPQDYFVEGFDYKEFFASKNGAKSVYESKFQGISSDFQNEMGLSLTNFTGTDVEKMIDLAEEKGDTNVKEKYESVLEKVKKLPEDIKSKEKVKLTYSINELMDFVRGASETSKVMEESYKKLAEDVDKANKGIEQAANKAASDEALKDKKEMISKYFALAKEVFSKTITLQNVANGTFEKLMREANNQAKTHIRKMLSDLGKQK